MTLLTNINESESSRFVHSQSSPGPQGEELRSSLNTFFIDAVSEREVNVRKTK